MKYVCMLVCALLGLIVHDVTSESQACSPIGQPCGSTAEYQCCDGLKCLSEDGDTRCGPWWEIEKSKSNKFAKVKLTKAEPFVESWWPWDTCIGFKSDCQADPNNCCRGLTCVEDALSFWTCR